MKGKYWKDEANAKNAESVNRSLLEYQNWWKERATARPFGAVNFFFFRKVFQQKWPYLEVLFLHMQDRNQMQIPSFSLNNPISYHIHSTRLKAKKRKKHQVPKVKDRQKSRVWIFCRIRSSNAPLARIQIQLQSLRQMNGTWQIPEMRNQNIDGLWQHVFQILITWSPLQLSAIFRILSMVGSIISLPMV